MRRILVFTLLLAGACDERRPPAPTAEQTDQLNDADAMLNDLANEEGPADSGPRQSATSTGTQSTGPSNSSD